MDQERSGTYPTLGAYKPRTTPKTGTLEYIPGSGDQVDTGEQQDGTWCGVVRQSGSDEKYNPGL